MALDDVLIPAGAVRLPIIARDSQSLSPTRSQLAHLLTQVNALRLEAEPLNEQLARCDVAIQHHDEALQHRDRLLEQHERLIAEAIARGTALPGTPDALTAAEIELRAAAIAESAVVKVRGRLQDALATTHATMAALQRESEELVATIAVEAALAFAEQEYPRAYQRLTAVAAVIDGIESELLAVSRMRLQSGGDGTVAARAVEKLTAALRNLRANLGAVEPDPRPARRLMASLQSDPLAELELGAG